MSCSDFEQMEAYVSGTLPPDERAAMDAHLSGCAVCRGHLDDIRANQEIESDLSILRAAAAPARAAYCHSASVGNRYGIPVLVAIRCAYACASCQLMHTAGSEAC